MKLELFLVFILGTIIGCGSVQLVPYVGGSAYSTDEQAVHAGVSFVPVAQEAVPKRASFRSSSSLEFGTAAQDDGLDLPRTRTERAATGDTELSDADLTAAWEEFFTGRGWSRPGEPEPVEAEAEHPEHAADTVYFGGYEVPLTAILSALAAAGFFKRREIAAVIRRNNTPES